MDPKQRARSINLALSDRGIKTLKKTGHVDDILEIAIPMKGRMVHSIDGDQSFLPYSSDSNKHLYSVSRQLLNEKLREHAEKLPNVKFHFSDVCKSVDFNNVSFETVSDGKTEKHFGKTIIGCDGAFSAVRNSMTRLDRQDYSQSYLKHGYKELSIPPGENGTFLIDKNSLHIWPRGSFMMIALPNIDGSFTCTLFFPFDGELSFKSLDTKEKVEDFFKKYFLDAYNLMPTIIEDYFTNPTSSLVTVKTDPFNVDGRAVLVGDAAHAIVPFYGQGMNAAFEDCLELINCLEDNSLRSTDQEYSIEHLTRVYSRYHDNRKKNSDAIAEMAVENFIEMRDSVADPLFLFKKKVEQMLEKQFPNRYISRYELISFSTEPYSYAQQTGLANQRILSKLVEGNTEYDINKIDLSLADKLIKEILNK
ncbi:hypothetical protein DICPUDRAFT_48629 [Dictyostelium purpureum]|uniref:FAD-binding domain-containing protein n=1 Tax=Dictyostelium purpureum TaxID=5786 RepID=F0ZPY2_DICPU|nr:uncharacterized protein DICPUDRAFT_48629 [Dictyostelium purpureum]EGC33986.1 hypothetical protein DICPUDRAFT_48629 [Dictyostelium purpureum]|eukprot:XP_003289472.1 hypothetical protein DICPUDRAFT_48629 [Dictyostelium purpureum]